MPTSSRLVRDWVPQSEAVRSRLLERVRVVRGDILDQPLMERVLGEYEIDTVVHLAAQTIVSIANRNPVGTLEANIRGTWVVLEAARRSPTREADRRSRRATRPTATRSQLPYSESTPLEGRHPYDVSKSCADLIAQMYAKTYELPVCITRCGNFYGRGDLNWNRIVPGTLRSLIRGERPVIRSDGKFVRDYIFVDDGAAAYLQTAEAMADDRTLIGEAFNFSNETPLTVTALVDRMLAVAGRPDLKPEIRNEASNEIRDQFLDATKARTRLGWKPRFSPRRGAATHARLVPGVPHGGRIVTTTCRSCGGERPHARSSRSARWRSRTAICGRGRGAPGADATRSIW